MDGTQPRHIATFCGSCSCGCPAVYLYENVGAARCVIIADDFGQRIEMSMDQLRELVRDVRAGVLDEVLGGTG